MIGLSRLKFVIFLCLAWLAGAPLSVSAAGLEENDLREIHKRLKQVDLPNARVVLGRDGRVELVGDYQNRTEVQIAFSVAQSVVGVKWVAPTTPENIRYPVEGLAEALSAHMRNIPVIQIPSSADGPPLTAPLPQQITTAQVNRYALVVGIGEFEHLGLSKWLKYSAKDAEDIYRFLISPKGGGFPKQNVALLTNQQATRRAVEVALDDLVARARPGDIVVIYISSHGAPLNDRGNMNIVMYDTRPKPRHEIFLSSLTDDKLSQTIHALDRTRLLIVLDTCFSGAAYAKVPGFLASGSKDLFIEDRKAVQGIPSSSLQYLAKGGKDLLVEPARADTGGPAAITPSAKVLISASDASEISWESEQLHNSFFTYYLLDGIRKHANVRDAYAYAKPAVSTAVQREKAATQTPQAVFLPADVDFNLTNSPGLTKGNQL